MRAIACLLVAGVMISVAGCSSESGWVTLLDGESGLENFNRVGEADWTAVDGAIQATSGPGGAAFLVTPDSYGDFELKEKVLSTVLSHKDGVKGFFENYENLDAGNARVNQLIQQAIDLNLIKNNVKLLRWEILDSDGKKKGELFQYRPSDDPTANQGADHCLTKRLL